MMWILIRSVSSTHNINICLFIGRNKKNIFLFTLLSGTMFYHSLLGFTIYNDLYVDRGSFDSFTSRALDKRSIQIDICFLFLQKTNKKKKTFVGTHKKHLCP